MFKCSLDQGVPPGQPGSAQLVENYLREFKAEEARAAQQENPLYLYELQRLRARRPRTLAELARKPR